MIDSGIHCDKYRNHDISFLYFSRYILFYRKEEWRLRLIKYDVSTKTMTPLDDYSIKEENQNVKYHPMFSSEFGSEINNYNFAHKMNPDQT